MDTYLALLRGINVGGKNKVPMAALKQAAGELGFEDVRTYIQSGNVVFSSSSSASKAEDAFEEMLPRQFKLDSASIMVLVLSLKQLEAVVSDAPKGFGKKPDEYKYDVAFLKGISGDEVVPEVRLNPDVDAIWAAPSAVYYRRLTSKLTKSRLSTIASIPAYKYMTIRNWKTTTKLLAMMQE